MSQLDRFAAGECKGWPDPPPPEVRLDYLRLGERFPHCDQRVLHAPRECEYCDGHPDWQAERIAKMVCFTGWDHERMQARFGEWYDHDERWEPCPADAARPPGASNDHRRWGGNKPTSAVGDPSWPAETFASAVMYGDQGGRAPWPLRERVVRRAKRPLHNLGYRLIGYRIEGGLRVYDGQHQGITWKRLGNWLVRR